MIKNTHSLLFKAIALVMVCLFLVNDIAWAAPSDYTSPLETTATLAAESRLKPFFEKRGLEFRNIAMVMCAAGQLRNLIDSEELRHSHIANLNKLFPNGAVTIEKEIRQASLKSGRTYKFAVFNFKKENKSINALFIKDHGTLTDDELLELGIDRSELHYLNDGVWFIDPEAPLSVSDAKSIGKAPSRIVPQEPPAKPRPIEARSDLEGEKIQHSFDVIKGLTEEARVLFVVPMHKEETRLLPESPSNKLGEDALRNKIEQFQALHRINRNFRWELLMVDDGSPGASSKRLVDELWKEIRQEYLEKGESLEEDQVTTIAISKKKKDAIGSKKGGAVRRGFERALAKKWADYIGYTDLDVSTDLRLTGLLLEPLVNDTAEVAVGSRWVKDSQAVNVPLSGKISSRLYISFIHMLFPKLRHISDTQRGFKLFKKKVVKSIHPFMRDITFSFDCELLVLAQETGYRLCEVGIAWFDSFEASTFSMMKNAPHAILKLLNLRMRLSTGSLLTAKPRIKRSSDVSKKKDISETIRPPETRSGVLVHVILALTVISTVILLLQNVDIMQNYLSLLSAYPLATKMITAFILGSTADTAAQMISQSKRAPEDRKFDFKRMAYFPFVCMMLYGLGFSFWLDLLSTMGTGIQASIAKIILQSAIFTTLYYLTFFTLITFFSQKSLKEAISLKTCKQALGNIKSKFWPTYKRDMVFWTLFVNPFNFLAIPLIVIHAGIEPTLTNGIIVFVSNFAAIFWDAYLSWISHKKEGEGSSLRNNVSVADLGGQKQVLVSLVPQGGKSFKEEMEELIDRLDSVLKENGLTRKNIVKQTVFLKDAGNRNDCRGLLSDYYNMKLPATSIINQPPAGGEGAVFEVLAIRAPPDSIDQVSDNLAIVRLPGETWAYVAGIEPDDGVVGTYEQALNCLNKMQSVLTGANIPFENVVRTWIYERDIVGQDPVDKIRYYAFNRARNDFFRTGSESGGAMKFAKGLPPASTGIGTSGDEFVMECLALSVKRTDFDITPVDNPKQTKPQDYPDKELRKETGAAVNPKPIFSRAMAIDIANHKMVLVSGTASIEGSEILYENDPVRQTKKTIDNIGETIKKASASLRDIRQIRVYIKDPAHYSVIRAEVEKTLPKIPCLYLIADVCKDKLLVEIEALVYKTRERTGAERRAIIDTISWRDVVVTILFIVAIATHEYSLLSLMLIGACLTDSAGKNNGIGLGGMGIVGIDFRKEDKEEVDKFFGCYFNREDLSYGKLFLDRKFFCSEMNRFFAAREETSWLLNLHGDRWSVYKWLFNEYSSKKPEDAKEGFLNHAQWIIEMGRNVHFVLLNQVKPGLERVKLSRIYNENISFVYRPESRYTVFFRSKDNSLKINLASFQPGETHALNALRYEIFYRLILHDRLSRENYFSRKEGEPVKQFEDEDLVGMAFNSEVVKKIDRIGLDLRLDKLVSEMVAYELSYTRNIREAGIRQGIDRAINKIKSGESASVLDISAAAAIAEITGYPQDDPDLEELVSYITREDRTYFRELKAEFMRFIASIELKNDFRYEVVPQMEFDQRFPSIAGKNFWYSRSGRAVIAAEDGSPEALAGIAQAKMLHRYQNRLNDLTSIPRRAAELVRKSPKFVLVLEKVLAMMGSRNPAMRAEDILFEPYGLFDNIALEGKEELHSFITPQEIMQKFQKYLKSKDFELNVDRNSDIKRGLAVFTMKFVPGGLAQWEVFSPNSPKNIAIVKYTLRGFIEIARDGDKDTYKIMFQGYDTRNTDKFMKQHGFPVPYTQADLEFVTHNETIMACQRLLAAGFPADTKVVASYKNEDGKTIFEENKTLADLARVALRKDHIYPWDNNPDYVPQSLVFVLGQVMAYYNKVLVKEQAGGKLTQQEEDYRQAVEAMDCLPELLELFPLFAIESASNYMKAIPQAPPLLSGIEVIVHNPQKNKGITIFLHNEYLEKQFARDLWLGIGGKNFDSCLYKFRISPQEGSALFEVQYQNGRVLDFVDINYGETYSLYRAEEKGKEDDPHRFIIDDLLVTRKKHFSITVTRTTEGLNFRVEDSSTNGTYVKYQLPGQQSPDILRSDKSLSRTQRINIKCYTQRILPDSENDRRQDHGWGGATEKEAAEEASRLGLLTTKKTVLNYDFIGHELVQEGLEIYRKLTGKKPILNSSKEEIQFRLAPYSAKWNAFWIYAGPESSPQSKINVYMRAITPATPYMVLHELLAILDYFPHWLNTVLSTRLLPNYLKRIIYRIFNRHYDQRTDHADYPGKIGAAERGISAPEEIVRRLGLGVEKSKQLISVINAARPYLERGEKLFTKNVPSKAHITVRVFYHLVDDVGWAFLEKLGIMRERRPQEETLRLANMALSELFKSRIPLADITYPKISEKIKELSGKEIDYHSLNNHIRTGSGKVAHRLRQRMKKIEKAREERYAKRLDMNASSVRTLGQREYRRRVGEPAERLRLMDETLYKLYVIVSAIYRIEKAGSEENKEPISVDDIAVKTGLGASTVWKIIDTIREKSGEEKVRALGIFIANQTDDRLDHLEKAFNAIEEAAPYAEVNCGNLSRKMEEMRLESIKPVPLWIWLNNQVLRGKDQTRKVSKEIQKKSDRTVAFLNRMARSARIVRIQTILSSMLPEDLEVLTEKGLWTIMGVDRDVWKSWKYSTKFDFGAEKKKYLPSERSDTVRAMIAEIEAKGPLSNLRMSEIIQVLKPDAAKALVAWIMSRTRLMEKEIEKAEPGKAADILRDRLNRFYGMAFRILQETKIDPLLEQKVREIVMLHYSSPASAKEPAQGKESAATSSPISTGDLYDILLNRAAEAIDAESIVRASRKILALLRKESDERMATAVADRLLIILGDLEKPGAEDEDESEERAGAEEILLKSDLDAIRLELNELAGQKVPGRPAGIVLPDDEGEDIIPFTGDSIPEADERAAALREKANSVLDSGEVVLYSDLTEDEVSKIGIARLVFDAQREARFWAGWDYEYWGREGRDALILLDGGRAVAVWSYKRESEYSSHGDGIYITKDYRGRRLGSFMREKMFRHLSDKGYEKFQVGGEGLNVIRKDAAAQGLWKWAENFEGKGIKITRLDGLYAQISINIPVLLAATEADKIHAENVDKFTPIIPDKTIICHIIADSILPVEQRKTLKMIEQKLRNWKYSEKIVSISIEGSEGLETFMTKLEAVKEQDWVKEYKAKGYKIRFDVACPNTDLVVKLQAKNIQALAFIKEGNGEIIQVEGIMMALRALDTGDMEKLLGVYRSITGKDWTKKARDITELAKDLLFTLPTRKVDTNAIGTLNRLMEENIKNAA